MFVHARPARSKRAMLEDVHEEVTASKLAARNTLDYTLADGTRKIRLHDTDIMIFHPTGMIELNTGGYNTKTTRERMNSFLPSTASVYTERGVIYARYNGETKPFTETATIDTVKGRILSDRNESDIDADRRALDAYMREWKRKGLPPQEKAAGDPWVFPNAENGKIQEYVMRDWVESKYVFRSLYIHAMRFAGIRDVGIGIYMDQIDRRKGKLEAIDTRRIRRYVRACLGYES
jgi:hypothetical protein